MTGQTSDTCHAGHANQATSATLHHCVDERMERGGQANVVGRQGLRHHIQIRPRGRVHADADAGIRHHHIGHALRRQTRTPCRHDAADVCHVGAIDLIAVCAYSELFAP